MSIRNANTRRVSTPRNNSGCVQGYKACGWKFAAPLRQAPPPLLPQPLSDIISPPDCAVTLQDMGMAFPDCKRMTFATHCPCYAFGDDRSVYNRLRHSGARRRREPGISRFPDGNCTSEVRATRAPE